MIEDPAMMNSPGRQRVRRKIVVAPDIVAIVEDPEDDDIDYGFFVARMTHRLFGQRIGKPFEF